MADNSPEPQGEELTIHQRLDSVLATLDADVGANATETAPSGPTRGPDGKFTKTDAPAEAPASVDDTAENEPAEAEQEAAPAIEPPASWTNEAKERFAKLDPDTQSYIVERETERERAVNLAKQEASNTAKTIDQEKAQIASERARYAETLKYIVDNAVFMDPTLSEGRKTNWAQLAAEDPATYVQKWAAYQQREAQLMATQQELQRVQGQNAWQQMEAATRELAATVPEWADEAKWKATSSKIGEYLSELGVPKERWAGIESRQVLNAAELRVVLDAVKWREYQKAKSSAPAKKVAEAPPKTAAAKTTQAVQKENPQAARLKSLARDSSISLRDRARATAKLIDLG